MESMGDFACLEVGRPGLLFATSKQDLKRYNILCLWQHRMLVLIGAFFERRPMGEGKQGTEV